MNKCCDKEYVKKLTTDGSSVEFIIENYNEFTLTYSCRPDEDKFPKYKTGDVIDEDKSVKWNREEIERRIAARDEEVKRLNREKAEIITLYEIGITKQIAKRHKLKVKEVELLFKYFYNEKHSYGVLEVFNALDNFIENVYLEIKKIK